VGKGSAWSTMQCANARLADTEASLLPRRRAKSREAMGASGVRGSGPAVVGNQSTRLLLCCYNAAIRKCMQSLVT